MVLRLPQGHEDSEYVLSFEIGQRESGFYSGPTDRRTNPHSTVLVYRFYNGISENSIQIGLLGTDIHNFGEICLILYNINLFEKCDEYRKKFICKTVLFSYFMFGY